MSMDFPECSYTVLRDVGHFDASAMGFSPADVLTAASVETAAETIPTDEVPTSLPVSLAHTFSSVGMAKHVDFGTPADTRCPSGAFLLVPAKYEVAGHIDGARVSDTHKGFHLLATAPDLASITTWFPEQPDAERWDGQVEEPLHSLAVTQVRASSQPCAMQFSLGPLPRGGPWGNDLTEGWLDWFCTSEGSSLLTWKSTVVSP